MIKVANINKSFQNTSVLRDISLKIKRGDFIAIMGPSGSGKSTLLYSISGMDKINNGEILFEDRMISDMKDEELADFRLRNMGFVFQNPQMLKNLSVLDNIILPGLVAKQEPADTIRKRGLKLMERMEIAELEKRDKSEVSGGQLQRASICRAMINNPDILFLDEPTGALNSEATDQVLDILESLNKEGMTILTVTHDKRVSAKAKTVYYLVDGEIAACLNFSSDHDRESELDAWLIGMK